MSTVGRALLLGLALLGLPFPFAGAAADASSTVETSRATPSDQDDRPAIVLVTFGTLRARDAGFLGGPPTPTLDRLAADATWAGPAVSGSSSPLVSLGILATGAPPVRNGLLSHDFGRLHAEPSTLATALGALGYRTIACFPLRSRLHRWGLFDGFDAAVDCPRGIPMGEPTQLDEAADDLALRLAAEERAGKPTFFWIHLPGLSFPLFGETFEAERPVTALDLYPAVDPGTSVPPELRHQINRRIPSAMARIDAHLGRLLHTLGLLPADTSSRQPVVLAVTATQGLDTGEEDIALYGESLGRSTLEVPLIVRLPSTTARLEPQGPVGTIRLWSTLFEAAGGRPGLAHAPSLAQSAPQPVLSSLYLLDGVNRFSWVDVSPSREKASPVEPSGDWRQLLWTARFAPADGEYVDALLARAGAPDVRLSRTVRRIFDERRRAFIQAPLLTGDGQVTLDLRSWPATGRAQGEVVPLDAPSQRDRAASALRRHWLRFGALDAPLGQRRP